MREALLHALLVDRAGAPRPGARLIRHDAEEAVALLPYSGECVVVRTLDEGDSAGAERLKARAAELRQAARGAHLSLVVLGGAAGVRRSVRGLGSFWDVTGPLSLFHVGDDGRLWSARTLGRGAARVRPMLGRAVAAVANGAPELSPAERVALAVEPHAAVVDSEDAAFWAALRRRTPIATMVLGLVIVGLFGLESLWGSSEWGETLFRMGACVPARAMEGQWWRLLSSAFLHIGFSHLAVNLWALYVLGPLLERLFGTARFLVLYGASALGGGVAGALFGSRGLMAGASGALWGLMVAQLALGLWPRGLVPESVRRQIQTRGWQPLAVNLFISLAPGISLSAHLGGGVVGGLLIASGLLTRGLPRPGSADPPRYEKIFARAAVLIAGAMAASIALALWSGRPWELWGITSIR